MSIVSGLIAEVNDLQDANTKLKEENARLRAFLNLSGDNLCFLTDKEIADMQADPGRIPPWSEFGESCRRFHAQVADSAGLLQVGQMTIAQLEAEVGGLRTELDGLREELQQKKDELAGCGMRAVGLEYRVEKLEVINEELRGRLEKKN